MVEDICSSPGTGKVPAQIDPQGGRGQLQALFPLTHALETDAYQQQDEQSEPEYRAQCRGGNHTDN